MAATSPYKRVLKTEEGHEIRNAIRMKGLQFQEFAQLLRPGAAHPERHLRAVLNGEEPLTQDYEHGMAKALGIGVEQLRRIMTGSEDVTASHFPSFRRVLEVNVDGLRKADTFGDGSRPTWEDLEAGFDIPRIAYTSEDGIRATLKRCLAEPAGLRALAILGAGGVGKSTLLRRAAYDAAKEGCCVLELGSEWMNRRKGVAAQLREACEKMRDAIIVVIDDISDVVFDNVSLSRILGEVEGLPIILLIAEHPDRWHGVLKRLPVLAPQANCWEHHVHALVDSECEMLVDRIMTYEETGLLSRKGSNLSRSERLAMCEEEWDRHLVVAMLQMRHCMKFQRIIVNEYNRIPLAAGKEAYLLVCYFETLRLPLPRRMLFPLVEVKSLIEIEEFTHSTDGLFEVQDGIVTSRNRLIARTVVKDALSEPEARKAALVRVLGSIDIEDPEQEELFHSTFAGDGVHRRIVSDLTHSQDLVGDFYKEILNRMKEEDVSLMKYILSSQGLAERVLQNNKGARERFEKAIELEPAYEFAYRQLAWLDLAERDWEGAARNIQKSADLDPYNFRANYDAARILTYNTVRWFPLARQYWLRVVEQDVATKTIQTEWETYQDCEKQLECVAGLKADDCIPEFIWKNLRPGLLFDKMRYGPSDRAVVKAARRKLKLMQQDTTGSMLELHESLEGLDIEEDAGLKALTLSNIARLEYVATRRSEAERPVDEIEKMFEESIHLNPADPFPHCWLGTLLKDVRRDFDAARRAYQQAIDLGNKSNDRLYKEHPLFLNNMALLIADEVLLRRRKPEDLKIAKKLLEKAVKRVPETKPDFFWAAHNLDWVNTLIKSSERRG